MTMSLEVAVFCDDCDNMVGSDTASQYDYCDNCDGVHLYEESLYVCSCGKFESIHYHDTCPVCGAAA